MAADEEATSGRVEQELSGYYPLETLANLVVGLPEHSGLRTASTSYILWAKAVGARKHGWRVIGGLSCPKGDPAVTVRRVESDEGSYADLSDFIEWAIESGYPVAPAAIERARRECDVSATFEARVQLLGNQRTRAELHSAKPETPEGIIARDARLDELGRERAEIIAFLQSGDLAPEHNNTPKGKTKKEELARPRAKEGATTPQQRGASLTNRPYVKSKNFCINQAQELWEQDRLEEEDYKLGKRDMLRMLQMKLAEKGMKQPSDEVLWRWLNEAGIVPDYACRPGRRPKKTPPSCR